MAVKQICINSCSMMHPDHLSTLGQIVINNDDASASALDIMKAMFLERPDIFLSCNEDLSRKLCAILGCGMVDMELSDELRQEEALKISGMAMAKLWPVTKDRKWLLMRY